MAILSRRGLLALLASADHALAKSTLFTGGTIIAFDDETDSLNVIRNGSLLITDDRIASVDSSPTPSSMPSDCDTIDVTGMILTPGFIDTHRHGWQTSFKTLGSNTTLVEYFMRYGEFVAGAYFDAEDVYISQLAGLYEALNAGVTTTLDHAHHTWSNETAEAGLRASIESGARVIWAYAMHNVSNVNLTIADQVPHFRSLAEERPWEGSATEMGIAYDFWGPDPVIEEVNMVVELIREYNLSVVTTHALGGPWGVSNMPTDVHPFSILNETTPFVFSHASFLTHRDANLLRSTNQYMSITPESEMHHGHVHPHSHLIMDQAALGVDTHFTFSTDILTQARLWLQSTRRRLYARVLEQWRLSPTNPMSAVQAFHLATRAGGLALRRPDLGVIAPGAKADVVIWDGDSPALLGWVDPVAAVILHASVADVLHVMVDGKFVKRDGKVTAEGYPEVKTRFLESAKGIQEKWAAMPFPEPEGTWPYSGVEYEEALDVDVQRGEAMGYGEVYIMNSMEGM